MPIQKQASSGPYTRSVLLISLDPTMHWHGKATGKRGRSPTFSDAAVQFCLALKGLLNIPLRQSMRATEKVLQAAGLNWPMPDFSTISRRRKKLREVFIDLAKPPGLHLVVDDNGIQLMTLGDSESRYWAGNRHRQWVKVQLSVELK